MPSPQGCNRFAIHDALREAWRSVAHEQPAAAQVDARCGRHAAPAAETCPRCGSYMCAACFGELGVAGGICRDCESRLDGEVRKQSWLRTAADLVMRPDHLSRARGKGTMTHAMRFALTSTLLLASLATLVGQPSAPSAYALGYGFGMWLAIVTASLLGVFALVTLSAACFYVVARMTGARSTFGIAWTASAYAAPFLHPPVAAWMVLAGIASPIAFALVALVLAGLHTRYLVYTAHGMGLSYARAMYAGVSPSAVLMLLEMSI